MQELLTRIESINGRIKEINTKAMREAGRREEIEKQLNAQIAKYNSTYGVNGAELSLDDMQKIKVEYNNEVAEKAKQATFLEEVIGLIENGKYQDAAAKLNINASVPTEEQKPVEQVSATTISEEAKAMNATVIPSSPEVKKPVTGGFKVPDMSQMPNVVGEAVVNSEVNVPKMTGNLAHNIGNENIPQNPVSSVPEKPITAPSMPTPAVSTMPNAPTVPVGVPNTPVAEPTLTPVTPVPTMPKVPQMPNMGVAEETASTEEYTGLTMGVPFQS